MRWKVCRETIAREAMRLAAHKLPIKTRFVTRRRAAMKAKDIRERSDDELRKTLCDLEEQLFKLRFQKSTGQIENPIKIREVRKDIARVLTVINERRAEESA